MRKRYFLALIKLVIKILPLSFWLVLIFAFDEPYIAILTLISAAIHELGHIIALVVLSKRYVFFGVSSGLRLSAKENLSYKEEFIVALCGPLINVFTFILLSPLILLGFGEYTEFFGLINLFTAISNLIPIEGYDGYRIAECLVNQYMSRKIPLLSLRAISFLLSALLCIVALYLIRSFDGGYWIFFIFLLSLFRAITSDQTIFPKKSHKR